MNVVSVERKGNTVKVTVGKKKKSEGETVQQQILQRLAAIEKALAKT